MTKAKHLATILLYLCSAELRGQDEKSAPPPNETPAAETASDNFKYPELLVSPRASERLELEAQRENRTAITSYLPVQVSALSAIAAGVIAKSDAGKLGNEATHRTFSNAAIGVGTAWLGYTLYGSFVDRPYGAGHQSLKPMPRKSSRDRLTRERMAEEALMAPARQARIVAWLAGLSNTASAAAVMSTTNDPTTRKIVGAAAVAALTPLFFDSYWQRVWSMQMEYKKKIYGPILTPKVGFAPSNQATYVASLQADWAW